jgi:HAD superfamily hydrolase (TIGR01509 family)
MPALFADLDGTLADSLQAMQSAFFQFVSSHGGDPAAFAFDRFNGPPLSQIVTILRGELGLHEDVDGLLDAYQRHIDQVYSTVSPAKGASSLLRRAKKADWVTAVVTSNNRRRVQSWLARTGLSEYCDFAVCAEDVGRGKPWPDPYLRALSLSGHNEAVAIEDGLQGAQSAFAAGLVTYGLQPADRRRLDWPSHITLVENFGELQHRLFGLNTDDSAGKIT